jgi:hypothetical protein
VAVTLDPTASSPTATNVVVFPEKVGGRITNVAGSTVTLTNKRGTDTVIVSSSTKYYEKGASPTAVSNGEVVTVFGLPDAGTPGELDAQVVAIFSPPTPTPTPTQPQPQTTRPQPQPTTAATQGPRVGTPRVQPALPETPTHGNPGGDWSAPSGSAVPHPPAGNPSTAATPEPLGGHGPGAFGGQGFGHR